MKHLIFLLALHMKRFARKFQFQSPGVRRSQVGLYVSILTDLRSTNRGSFQIEIFRQIFSYGVLAPMLLSAQPWGKDADLAHPQPMQTHCYEQTTPLLTPLARYIIRFHQEVISPADGPRSHYIPSSSQYMLDAINKYGFFTGYAMGCDRLMRENNDPWVYSETVNSAGELMKYDPVP